MQMYYGCDSRRVIGRTATGWHAAALRWVGAALCAGLLSQGAQAVPVTWTLSGVMFDDGGTASGTFVYDADIGQFGQFSAINIVTTPNSDGLGTTYGVATGIGTMLFFDTVEGFPLTGTDRLLFFLVSPLTDAGGAISISTGAEGTCTNATCSFLNPFRLIGAGGVVGRINGVPEPAPWGLALLALIAGALGRRKTR